jgi:hypothetical protein
MEHDDDPTDLFDENSTTTYTTSCIRLVSLELHEQFSNIVSQWDGLMIMSHDDHTHRIRCTSPDTWMEVRAGGPYRYNSSKKNKIYCICWEHGVLAQIVMYVFSFSSSLTFYLDKDEIKRRETILLLHSFQDNMYRQIACFV